MYFQLEASGVEAQEVVESFWRSFDPDPEGREYADAAVFGIAESRGLVDAEITKASAHWRLERMARVDRNVLRLGAWELLHRKDVPRAVILDEAVELVKTYSTDDSGSFVNGILATIAPEVRPA